MLLTREDSPEYFVEDFKDEKSIESRPTLKPQMNGNKSNLWAA